MTHNKDNIIALIAKAVAESSNENFDGKKSEFENNIIQGLTRYLLSLGKSDEIMASTRCSPS